MILQQLTKEQAQAAAESVNENYKKAGANDSIISVCGQLSNYFVATIPADKLEEFNNADTEKQNNFAIITSKCFSPEHKERDFVTAWNVEYNKIY
tara:strand:+ start:625 stop:909 length:285 start_codon:yes stop_codon:yes gene_type:complete